MNHGDQTMRRLSVGLACACALAILAAVVRGDEGKERKIPLEQVPAAARAAIVKAVGDGRIVDIGEITVNGKVTRYEVECMKGDTEIDIVVAPDGQLINEADDDDADDGDDDGDDGDDEKGASSHKPAAWRTTFEVRTADLGPVGRNPYFILVPGYKIHLAGEDDRVVISVLEETKVVDGVRTRVIEEREFHGEKLVEVSRNYFAADKATNDVYYFGEDVDVYDSNGKVTGHPGAWLSGVDGARFGLIMPGKPVAGDRYYQELAPKVAMDRAEIVKLGAALETPMKNFAACLSIKESSDLEKGFSHKWYAAGVGMIGDDELRIVKVEAPAATGAGRQ